MGSSSSFVRWRLTNGHLTFCLIQNSTDMKRYIVYAWKHDYTRTAALSRDNETLEEFRKRMHDIFPHTEGWHCQFSEFKEIW